MNKVRSLVTTQHVTAVALIAIWIMVLTAVPTQMPTQPASWLTFLALLITPGYLLTDIVTWRLALDELERLALALPLGIAVLAIPGTAALLLHRTIDELAIAWAAITAGVIILWFINSYFIHDKRPQPTKRWATDEWIMLALLALAFIVILPTLTLYKIDGDAFAVNSFAADALAGQPLNQTEPLFGTDLGPGVRMVFNQSLTLNYLWSYFSGIDPNTLIATASKAMLALWALLAAYTLGKAAGEGSRRFGLLTASITLLIYLAAPFIRGDNVSLFFFERINADKFMVPVTMLPVVFAFCISFVRDGKWSAWAAAAIATFAVSTIHPLIAAMLALAVGAFAALHLLMNLRRRTAWLRVSALGGLIVIVLLLPVVQLFLSQGEAPLASSYPSSFEDWDVGQKSVPVLPFIHLNSLDYYGPLPNMAELEAADVYETTNPFLVWRFAINMTRRRLILFDIDSYISDPSLLVEPAYFLSLLLLPMFLWRLRRDEAAQFVVAASLAVLFVMFNPLITPLIGSFVMPWILWRFVWILPYALIFALAARQILAALIAVINWSPISSKATMRMTQFAPLALVLLLGLALTPGIVRNIDNLNGRIAFSYAYPTPEGIFERLNEALATHGPATVLAEQDLSVALPAFVADAHIVAHRTPTTSEIFPADQQDHALQRLLDQYNFFTTPYLTSNDVDTLTRYDVGYVVASSGSDLDMQLRLANEWFTWLADDQAFSLYRVTELPQINETILGNTAMVAHDWPTAATHFETALAADDQNLIAQVGLAQIARRRGQFNQAEDYLQQAIAQADLPILHYQLGQLYADQGRIEESIAEFTTTKKAAPQIGRFQVALGDACLSADDLTCATQQFATAVDLHEWRDESGPLIALADLWRQRGHTERSLPLYKQAAEVNPSEYNIFVLVSAYRELDRFDEAAEIMRSMRVLYPLSAEIVTVQADLEAAQGNYEPALSLLRHAIWLQELQVQETTRSHLALADLLLETGDLEEAAEEIAYAVELNPFSPIGHTLRGDLFAERQQQEASVRAYQRAFELDPTQTGVYVALSNQLRQNGGEPDDVMVLLQTALRVDADETTLLLALGDQWQRRGDAKAAIEAYQSAIEGLAPYGNPLQRRPLAGASSRAFAFSRVAATYEDMGDTEAAMNYFHAAAAAAPTQPWPYLLLGDAARRQNEIDTAVTAYEDAINQDSSYVDAYLRLADLYEATGDSRRAGLLNQRVLELTTQDVAQNESSLSFVSWPTQTATAVALNSSDETLLPAALAWPSNNQIDPLRVRDHSDIYAIGSVYQKSGQDNQAVELYLQRLQQGVAEGWSETVMARYHKELGDLYLVRNEPQMAVATYKDAIKLDSWWPEARLGLAEALFLQDKSAAALAQLETAVTIAPGSVEAQIALANALDDVGRPTEAMTIYVNTARNHPGNGLAALALARAWQNRNSWEQAVTSFEATIVANPGAADAYVGLAELRMDVGEYETALALLEQAQSIDYNNVSSYIRLGELAQRQGDTTAALSWYQKAATLPAADQTLNLTLIDSLVRYGDYETALTYTEQALVQKPADTDLLLRQGRIQRIYGAFDVSLDAFSEAQANDPGNGRIYIELAELFLARGQQDTALAAYEQAIALEPQEASYYIAASQLLAAQNEPQLAHELLIAGLTAVPEPATLYDAIATLQLQQGRPDDALDTLRVGLNELGENTEMLLAMGKYYVNRANFEQVEERYNQALAGQPDVASVHIALGDLHLRRSELDDALAQYQEAITLDPATPSHYLALGTAYEAAEAWDKAEESYQDALIVAPTIENGYLSLGLLYEKQAQLTKASAIYEEGLAIAPTSGQLLTQFAALKLAKGDQEGAFALLAEAGRMAPTSATLITRAGIYTELEMLAEAQTDLEAALLLEPAAVEALVALGDLYWDQGDITNAEDYYLRAAKARSGVPTGFLRMATMAREAENRDAVVYWNDLARQADPGGLARPDEE